ncbi:unnamed protein product [Clonostachys rhizophaga]|uniref:Ammonium transporter n=1 Tax=Clonostachys rhizophaga TaxID=160324 RepID=A0A9N9V119_9HYPO|nr:unnamed protein product [Clonostachys rhizophaga]
MSSAGLPPVEAWPEYSENPLGANPLEQNINSPYNKGDLCWLLVATCLCWQITPAIGFLYAGMHRRKSALTMVFQSLFCACAVAIQFWLYGYSLYQAHTTNPILGDLSKGVLYNVLAYPSLANSDIPDILYATFGCTFVTATAMILAGAMLERGRLFPSMLFILCWTTFVYYFLAYWEWNPSGWLYKLGVLDFAGSGPVHIASGFGALAWALMLGKRVDPYSESHNPKMPHFKGHNPFLVGLGTILIWFAWFAFNGASTANLSIRSIYVVMNTNLAASGGGVAWTLLEYAHTRKFSIVGFCSGIISGLVGITPAAGFVPVYLACLVGALTSLGCFYTNRYKYLLRIDEGLDIWAIHGMGGVFGDILTGFFAADFVPALDGVTVENAGGWYSRNFKQMGYQLAAALTCAAWSFAISCLLLFVINKIPGCHIRESEEDELQGLDRKYFSDFDMEMYDGMGVSSSQGSAINGVSGSSPAAPVAAPGDQPGEKRD